MKGKQIRKQIFCMLFHQDNWKKYIVGREPRVTLAICSKCFESHVVRKGGMTREERDHRLDQVLKTKFFDL